MHVLLLYESALAKSFVQNRPREGDEKPSDFWPKMTLISVPSFVHWKLLAPTVRQVRRLEDFCCHLLYSPHMQINTQTVGYVRSYNSNTILVLDSKITGNVIYRPDRFPK